MERFDTPPEMYGECPPLSEEQMELIGRFLSGEIDLSLSTEELSELMIRADIW